MSFNDLPSDLVRAIAHYAANPALKYVNRLTLHTTYDCVKSIEFDYTEIRIWEGGEEWIYVLPVIGISLYYPIILEEHNNYNWLPDDRSILLDRADEAFEEVEALLGIDIDLATTYDVAGYRVHKGIASHHTRKYGYLRAEVDYVELVLRKYSDPVSLVQLSE